MISAAYSSARPNPSLESTLSFFSNLPDSFIQNVNRAGNVSGKLRYNTAKVNVNQPQNNQRDHNTYHNKVSRGGSQPVIVNAETGNVDATVEHAANGQDTVSQAQNNNSNDNKFSNKVTSKSDASTVVFDAGNTSGHTSQVTGDNGIHQSGNNGGNHNTFINE